MQRKLRTSRAQRGGFTLVEMLVAVALVLLMMTLFAEIFNLTTGAMTKMKGIAENDQRARIVANLLQADIDRRTFRDVIPFAPATDVLGFQSDEDRFGYLSYSENLPEDDTDDVLRLTIDATRSSELQDNHKFSFEPLFGRATRLNDLALNPNQPEGDDGHFIEDDDSSGMSRYAEVVWFLRGGKLYRRMMLLRDPYLGGGVSIQPTDGPTGLGGDTINTGDDYTFGSSAFWRDFDYSAHYHPTNNRVEFLSGTALTIPAALDGQYPLSLGVPHRRFGHALVRTDGTPREFTPSGEFFGAFTHEETSHSNFIYPGRDPGMNHPYLNTTPLTLNPTGEINEYAQTNGGTPDQRIGEDIVLSNVLSFDIQIWDPTADPGPDGVPGFPGNDDANGTTDTLPADVRELGWPNSDDGAWVNLGEARSSPPNTANPRDHGMYLKFSSQSNIQNSGYGNRFDTWYPFNSSDGTVFSDLPPYRAMRFVPADWTNMAANLPGRVVPRWTVNNSAYQIRNTVVFPPISDTLPSSKQLRFAYRLDRVIDATGTTVTSGAATSSDGSVPISWDQLGDEVREPPNGVGETLIWKKLPNLIPLKALRVTVRYLDPSSAQVRDLTVILPLRDDGQSLAPAYNEDGISY